MLYTYKRAAEYLGGWSVRTVHRWAAMIGKKPSRVGRYWVMLFTREELERMREKRNQDGRPGR